MKYYCIINTERAAPALLRVCPFFIRGIGAFIEAETVADVLRMDAEAGGRLTESDIMEPLHGAIENILARVPQNRR